jgi:hypothetical protein
MKTVDAGVANGAYTNNEVLVAAEAWFTKALTTMGATPLMINAGASYQEVAYLARARVRLALGKTALAAADAEMITNTNFSFTATRDASVRTRWNPVFRAINGLGYASMAPAVLENGAPVKFTGYRKLTISTADGAPTVNNGNPDTRVPVDSTNLALQDGSTLNWQQRKYLSLEAGIPVARWAEAQLILAEIKSATDIPGAIGHINAIRTKAGLQIYTGPTDAATVRDLIIEEGRREFFFEGRFLATKLRRDLWFPHGQGFAYKQMPYGTATCFVMPLSEYQNNSNIPFGYEGPPNRL